MIANIVHRTRTRLQRQTTQATIRSSLAFHFFVLLEAPFPRSEDKKSTGHPFKSQPFPEVVLLKTVLLSGREMKGC